MLFRVVLFVSSQREHFMTVGKAKRKKIAVTFIFIFKIYQITKIRKPTQNWRKLFMQYIHLATVPAYY